MGYTYTPTYYSSLQDSITSICKNILPFSFKKRRLPAIAAAEQRLSKQQSDNLKWQQESFHQILHLMALCKEGIVQEDEVSAFRTHLLETILTAPPDYEPALILRDKLIFLQELFYANCILEDEYHSSKRPLLQRLAVQGAVIGARDVIVGAHKDAANEEWSVIDLNEKPQRATNKMNEASMVKRTNGFESNKKGDLMSYSGSASIRLKGSRNALVCSTENPFWNDHINDKENESKSILMMESLPEVAGGGDSVKRKAFGGLFRREQHTGGGRGNENDQDLGKSAKKTWGFDGFIKWKKNDAYDETTPLSLCEKSDYASFDGAKVNGERRDKDLGRKMKEELSQIQAELRTKNGQAHLSNDRAEEISNQLPADNNDLKKFFPKSWCDQNGNAVLEVVRREFKDHVNDMGSYRQTAAEEKHRSKRWATFDDEENSHPNLFAPSRDNHQPPSSAAARLSSSKGFKYNPFFDM